MKGPSPGTVKTSRRDVDSSTGHTAHTVSVECSGHSYNFRLLLSIIASSLVPSPQCPVLQHIHQMAGQLHHDCHLQAAADVISSEKQMIVMVLSPLSGGCVT